MLGFLSGLREDIQYATNKHEPHTLKEAFKFARQERAVIRYSRAKVEACLETSFQFFF